MAERRAAVPAPDGGAGSDGSHARRVGSGMAILLSAEGRQFECSAQAIRNRRVRQADRDEGRREDGLTSAVTGSCRRALSWS